MPKTKTSSEPPLALPMPSLGQRLLHFLKHHAFIIILTSVFVILSTIIITALYTRMMNPDAMSYFSIAQKYAAGDFRQAINGYWGPLLSWLLVPAVWMGMNLSVAGKLVSVLASVGLLLTMYGFFERRKVSRWISSFLLIATSIYLFEWSVVGAIAPDVIMAFLMVLLAAKLSDFMHKPSMKLGIYLGCIGALLYFCKGFGFYLFIAMVALAALWQMVQSRSFWPIVRRYVPAALAFVVLVVPFVAAISVKYDKLTINNAGAFNQHVNSPHYKGVQPIEVMGPLPLPNDSAVSPWEDPTIFVNLIPGWSPLESRSNLEYFYYNVFYGNVLASFRFLYQLGPIMAAGLLLACIGSFRKARYRQEYAIFTAMTVMMFGAYIVVFILDRYLWAGVALAMLSVGLWAQTMLEKDAITKRQIALGGLLLCASLLILVGKHVADGKRPNIIEYQSSLNVKAVLPERTKVVADNFSMTNYACFNANLRCYNVLVPPASDHDQAAYYDNLKKMGIHYFLDYHSRENDPNLQKFIQAYYEPVNTATMSPAPTIYKLKD
jgi:hypothetical protein